MNRFMIGVVVLLAALWAVLAFQRPTLHEYEITFDGEAPRSVEAQVCGRRTKGEVGAGKAYGRFPVRCEGDGQITLKYREDVIECPIGYVTPGMSARWSFSIVEGACVSRSMELGEQKIR